MESAKPLNYHISYTITFNNYFMHPPLTMCRYHMTLIFRMVGIAGTSYLTVTFLIRLTLIITLCIPLSQHIDTTRQCVNTTWLWSSHIARGWLINILNAYIPRRLTLIITLCIFPLTTCMTVRENHMVMEFTPCKRMVDTYIGCIHSLYN